MAARRRACVGGSLPNEAVDRASRKRLLARFHQVCSLASRLCGTAMPIIARITAAATIGDTVLNLGPPTAPPRIASAHGPPPGYLPDDGAGAFDPGARPAAEHAFNQRIAR